jgi:hypothetical protein
VIKPKNSTIPIPPDGGTVVIEYLINKFHIIPKLIDQSYFCTQELYIECNNATFDIAVDGWYSRDGVLEKYWPGGDIGKPIKSLYFDFFSLNVQTCY